MYTTFYGCQVLTSSGVTWASFVIFYFCVFRPPHSDLRVITQSNFCRRCDWFLAPLLTTPCLNEAVPPGRPRLVCLSWGFSWRRQKETRARYVNSDRSLEPGTVPDEHNGKRRHATRQDSIGFEQFVCQIFPGKYFQWTIARPRPPSRVWQGRSILSEF